VTVLLRAREQPTLAISSRAASRILPVGLTPARFARQASSARRAQVGQTFAVGAGAQPSIANRSTLMPPARCGALFPNPSFLYNIRDPELAGPGLL